MTSSPLAPMWTLPICGMLNQLSRPSTVHQSLHGTLSLGCGGGDVVFTSVVSQFIVFMTYLLLQGLLYYLHILWLKNFSYVRPPLPRNGMLKFTQSNFKKNIVELNPLMKVFYRGHSRKWWNLFLLFRCMSDHLKRILASLHNIEEDIGELAEKVNGG